MLRIGFKIISVIFHPLFALMYILLFLLWVNPLLLASFTPEGRTVFFIYFAVNTVVIPMIAILLMKMLGLISSLQMETNKERIGPMIIVFILYVWMFINFKKEPDIPLVLVSLLLGTVISTAIAFMINVVNKISLHMTGMGGLLAAVIIIFLNHQTHQITVTMGSDSEIYIHSVPVIIIIVLLTGLVASARLFLNAHKPIEVLQGVVLGFAAQFLAFWIIF